MARFSLLCCALIACAGAHGGGGSATFRVFYPDAPATGFTAKAGKRFYAKPVSECRYENGRDARWSTTGAHVSTGELPPGLALEDGAITGKPTKPGSFTATVTFGGVTCAGKPYPDQPVDVVITVK